MITWVPSDISSGCEAWHIAVMASGPHRSTMPSMARRPGTHIPTTSATSLTALNGMRAAKFATST